MEIKASRPEWLVSIGQGLAWLAASFGVLLSAIFIREFVLEILTWYRTLHLEALQKGGVIAKELETNTRLSAVDFIMIFILTCAAAWAVIDIEYYFRKGRAKGLLLKRILKVAGIEAGIILGSVLLRMLLQAIT